MIGSTLGSYSLREALGSGGMGTVYRAHDPRLERDVALKLLKPEFASDPERRARFLREAKSLAALQHPNVVTVHSVEEAGDNLFLTMELIEGRTLDAVIPGGGLPLAEFLRTAIPMADAVAYAHSKGITHRDLKPTNIMVDNHRRVRVLDFGLAKLLEQPTAPDGATVAVDQDVTSEGKILGTAAYMSPEQAEGKALDHRSDIFSLGVVLYEMATGRRPFQGDTHISTISAVLKDTPRLVTEINTRLPRHLARIIHRCLEKDPERRYQTAADLRIDLEGLKEESESGVNLETAPMTSNRPTWLIPVAVGFFLVVGGWMVANLLDRGEEAASTQVPQSNASAAASAPEQTLIAVLPFRNLGADEDAYFAEGITEEIMSRLAGRDGIRVISRTSARVVAQSGKTLPEIGSELGVAYVVDGSVRWEKQDGGPGRVRVTPQLVQVSDDTQLWSARYDESVTAIFEVQERIADAVSAELERALGHSLSPVDGHPGLSTTNLDAYQAYLKGRSLMYSSLDPSLMDSVLTYFDYALSLDPEFWEALSARSIQHSARVHMMVDTSEDRLALARADADRILANDPNDPLGHLALGYYYYWGRKDYDRAIAEFEKTGRLDADAEVMNAMAFALRRRGDWERALSLLERSRELDPKNWLTWVELGFTNERMGRPQEALEAYRKSADLSERKSFVFMMMGMYEATVRGDLAPMRRTLDAMGPDNPDRPMGEMWYAHQLGDYAEALAWADKVPVAVISDDEIYLPLSLIRFNILTLMDSPDATAAGAQVIQDLEAVIAENPKDWRVRVAYGVALALAGRGDEAIREARLATDLMPVTRDAVNGERAMNDQAAIYLLAGREDEAAALFRERLQSPYSGLTPNAIRFDPRLHGSLDSPAMRSVLEPTP